MRPEDLAGALRDAGAGLSFGEIAALRWEDVHFDREQTLDRTQRGKLHIVRQVARGTHAAGPLKTRSRERWVDLLWPVRQALLDTPQRATTPPGLVVCGVHGGYLSHNWWYRAIWQPACQRAGLPGLHFHTLRHAFASLMAAWGLLGEFPLYVASQMGHADATTTMRVYARLMREGVRLDKEATLRALYAAYRGEAVRDLAVPVLPPESATASSPMEGA
ncbi:MAG TPA: site-specific integrase [bacterium]|nr:site-specific integrase [bacterium]